MNALQAIIRMEKSVNGNDRPVVIFPMSIGKIDDTNSCGVRFSGRRDIISDVKDFIENKTRVPETDDEKLAAYDLMMEISYLYKKKYDEIIWITEKFKDDDYKMWEQARIDLISWRRSVNLV